MTLDEAIKHCLDIADGQDKCADISVSEHAKERIRECANDHRQLAEWLTELKEARRLLKAAVEDFREINSDILTCKYCKWYSAETVECSYPDDVPCEQICGWKHADEALALIDKDTDVPATEGDTNVGRKVIGDNPELIGGEADD